jgi:hypothetical protein
MFADQAMLNHQPQALQLFATFDGNHLDVLIIDLHPLQTVHILNFIDQVCSQAPQHPSHQNIVRYHCAINNRHPAHKVTLGYGQMTAFRDQIFFGF